MKRFLAVLAATLLIFTFGCENVSYDDSSSANQPETSVNIYEELENVLPELNLPSDDSSGGAVTPDIRSFTVITNDTDVFVSSENSSGMIKPAIEERNQFLRYKYGAEVKAVSVNESEVTQQLKNALESGTTYCDMLSLSAGTTVSLYLSGCLTDMNKLPEFNLDSGYFDSANAKALATNSSLYLLANPSNLVYEETYALFYNKNIVTNSGAENPETLVMQGKWTWDKFLEISKTAASEVFNKSSADVQNDLFAYGAYYEEGTYPIVMWTSAGKKLIDNTYKSPVALSMSADEAETLGRQLKSYYDTKGKYLFEGDDAMNAFESGRLVFFCNKLDYLYALRDTAGKGSEYGLLPLPKLNETQESYHCLVGNDARVISVPKTVENTDESNKRFVSFVLSALCAAGGNTVKEAYVSAHITLYLNNNAEAVMFDTICESITFDFSNVYGSSISEVRRVTTAAVSDYIDFGSDISNSINNARSAFEKYTANNFT